MCARIYSSSALADQSLRYKLVSIFDTVEGRTLNRSANSVTDTSSFSLVRREFVLARMKVQAYELDM